MFYVSASALFLRSTHPMLPAPQIDPGHVGSNHWQTFHFDLVVGLPGFFAANLHPVIRLSEHDSPGRPNWDSGLALSGAANRGCQSWLPPAFSRRLEFLHFPAIFHPSTHYMWGGRFRL